MKINAGMPDRMIRALVGIVLIALTLTGTIGAWGWIGVLPLLTGIVGYCPMYTVLKMSTCKRKPQ